MLRRLLLAAPVVALAVVLAACGGGASPAAEPESAVAPPAPPALDATIVDVRTPGEFAAGHVAGAVNIDVQADDFDDRIAELAKDGAYVVYCRSGNRSAQAVERMRAAGFTDLTDGGGLEDMTAAGYALGS
ncbi:MAG: rhodanese-like domain-containing protein [Thermoleophilia bacterium]